MISRVYVAARGLLGAAAMRSLVSAAVPVIALMALVAACNDVPTLQGLDEAPAPSSGTATTRPPKKGGTTGTTETPPWNPHGDPWATSSSSSGLVTGVIPNVDSIGEITLSKDTCMPQPYCYDAQTFTVDFNASRLTTVTCVEVAAADGGIAKKNARTTKELTAEQLESVRERLSGIRTSSSPVTGFDGPILLLEVNGVSLYSPDAGCGPQDEMTKITDGWYELWTTVSAL